uniref:zinc-binding dehydrogenase n=1 Tax=Jiella pelagia TaxID=2986949 RepID=UPI002E33ED66|nr:zinc-binding dehydrogenase [Jiella pelagia]
MPSTWCSISSAGRAGRSFSAAFVPSADTSHPERSPGRSSSLDLRTLYLKDQSLLGSTHQPENVFTDLVRYIEAGDIRPLLATSYPLREIREAQTAFMEKSHVGKIGLVVAGA